MHTFTNISDFLNYLTDQAVQHQLITPFLGNLLLEAYHNGMENPYCFEDSQGNLHLYSYADDLLEKIHQRVEVIYNQIKVYSTGPVEVR